MVSDRCRELDEGLRNPHGPRYTALRDWLDSLDDVEHCISRGLRLASESGDWLDFEKYVIAADQRPSRSYTAVLCNVLARQDIEVNHENIVEALGQIRDPASISRLRETLSWEPDWDEYRNLAVKCIWALAAIGTQEAMDVIQEVKDSEAIKIRWAADHVLKRGESS